MHAAVADKVSTASAWAALRTHLEGRGRERIAEVSTYPTPIARCDVQLTKLLEQRDRTYDLLRRMDAIDAAGADPERMRAFLADLDSAEDEAETALRAGLTAVLD